MGRHRTRQRHGREARRAAAAAVIPMTQPLYDLPVYDLLDGEGLDKIHNASLEILSDVGIDFYDDESQSILRQHGVKLASDTAFFDREMIAEYVAKAPSQFIQLARNPANNVVIGGNHLGTEHTIRNFLTAFHRADLFDYNSYEQWQEEGGQSAAQRANSEYKKQLKAYQPPTLDLVVDEALQAFMARRIVEIRPEF